MEYYIANISFSGKISMHEGEIRNISGKALIKDLTKAGYIRKLNKKEVEAMKVLGLIKEEEEIEEEIEEENSENPNKSQDENPDGEHTDGQDSELEGDSDEDEEENSEGSEDSKEDVVTNEGK